jgi:hypothetical protein
MTVSSQSCIKGILISSHYHPEDMDLVVQKIMDFHMSLMLNIHKNGCVALLKVHSRRKRKEKLLGVSKKKRMGGLIVVLTDQGDAGSNSLSVYWLNSRLSRGRIVRLGPVLYCYSTRLSFTECSRNLRAE